MAQAIKQADDKTLKTLLSLYEKHCADLQNFLVGRIHTALRIYLEQDTAHMDDYLLSMDPEKTSFIDEVNEYDALLRAKNANVTEKTVAGIAESQHREGDISSENGSAPPAPKLRQNSTIQWLIETFMPYLMTDANGGVTDDNKVKVIEYMVNNFGSPADPAKYSDNSITLFARRMEDEKDSACVRATMDDPRLDKISSSDIRDMMRDVVAYEQLGQMRACIASFPEAATSAQQKKFKADFSTKSEKLAKHLRTMPNSVVRTVVLVMARIALKIKNLLGVVKRPHLNDAKVSLTPSVSVSLWGGSVARAGVSSLGEQLTGQLGMAAPQA